MARGLDEKVAIVTGSGRGIGRAIARRFAREGAAVLVSDIDPDPAHETVAAIQGDGGRAALNVCDVSDERQVAAMFDAAEAALGPVDIIVNNAGYVGAAPLVDETVESWDAMFAVNVRGVFLGLRHAARCMIPRGSGCVINIASSAGKQGRANLTAYCATKHAVIGLTRAAAHELASHGIRVNALCPGIVDTRFWEMLDPVLSSLEANPAGGAWERGLERIPLGRYEQPEDVANAAVLVASDDASYMTGQSISVDGGMVMH